MSAIRQRYVLFDLPFPLVLDDTSETNPELYIAGDPPAAIRLVRAANEREKIQTNGVLLGGDPYGRVAYTRLQIRFNADFSPVVRDYDDDEMIQCAIARANSLIETYRDVFADPFVTPLVVNAIAHFRLIEERDDESEPLHRFISRAAGPLWCGPLPPDMADRQDQLRLVLAAGARPDVFRTIYLDIEKNLGFGEYRVAILDAAMLFEAWLRPALIAKFVSNGMDPISARARLESSKGIPHSIYKLVTKVVAEATGFDTVDATPEFAAWNELRQARNDLIHGTPIELYTPSALRLVGSIFAFRELLEQQAGLG